MLTAPAGERLELSAYENDRHGTYDDRMPRNSSHRDHHSWPATWRVATFRRFQTLMFVIASTSPASSVSL
jgi:hypothetical protein